MINFIEQYRTLAQLGEIVSILVLVVSIAAGAASGAALIAGCRLHSRLTPVRLARIKTLADRSSLVALAALILIVAFAAIFIPRQYHLLTKIGEQAIAGAPTGATVPDHAELGTCVVGADLAAVPAMPTSCTARLLDGDSVSAWTLVVGNDRTQWVRIV